MHKINIPLIFCVCMRAPVRMCGISSGDWSFTFLFLFVYIDRTWLEYINWTFYTPCTFMVLFIDILSFRTKGCWNRWCLSIVITLAWWGPPFGQRKVRWSFRNRSTFMQVIHSFLTFIHILCFCFLQLKLMLSLAHVFPVFCHVIFKRI